MFTDMNSGYTGYSMSNRAAEAYQNGERPLSKWTKKDIINEIREYARDNNLPFSIALLDKVKAKVLKDSLLKKTSWHHTSSFANKTNFYSIDYEKISVLKDEDIRDLLSVEEEPKEDIDTFRGDIHYLEWGGTRRHPKAEKKELLDVDIKEKGSFYIVYDKNGNIILRKKIGSNGTYIVNYDEEKRKTEEERKRIQSMRANSSKKALDFYDSIKEKSYSFSNHIYPRGRKPDRYAYEKGLQYFFKVGEHRLFQESVTGVLHLETWNGTEWIQEE